MVGGNRGGVWADVSHIHLRRGEKVREKILLRLSKNGKGEWCVG